MSREPLISVVLPTHDRREQLPRAMRSVLMQTHRALELIVVDDASTDGTAELLSRCDDPRVSVIRRRERGGPARARNEGLSRARGKFVAFQDSDDEWLTTKLETQCALLGSGDPAVGLVLCSYLIHEPDGARLVHSAALVAGRDYEADLLLGNPVATPTWLARTQVLRDAGGFDPGLPCLEDWDLALRLHGRCKFRAVGEPMLVKYGDAATISADPERHLRGLRAIHERHRSLWLRHPAQAARWLREIGLLECRFGSRRRGIAALAAALRRRPLRPALYWSLAAAIAGRGALRLWLGRP